nr:hypothetical protein [Flavobacteriales bacterium]
MAEKHYVVGIAGGSASGKTSFLQRLKENLPAGSVSIISQDNYYKPKNQQLLDENGEVNYDLPTSIDKDAFLADLNSLLNDSPINIVEYCFNKQGATPKHIRVN